LLKVIANPVADIAPSHGRTMFVSLQTKATTPRVFSLKQQLLETHKANAKTRYEKI
jgi:hypothetical protein